MRRAVKQKETVQIFGNLPVDEPFDASFVEVCQPYDLGRTTLSFTIVFVLSLEIARALLHAGANVKKVAPLPKQ